MIDTTDNLMDWLPQLRAAEWVALDTEADSLHAYPEKLCLIQISTADRDVLLDPLAGLDLAPLWEALQSRRLILHAGDYDLRLLQKNCGFVPAAIFDTMLAARLLGCARFGLSDLVEQFLGIKLEKGPQKANWARRPLTERMEIYARNDTHYLKPLADLLEQKLIETGRQPWHEESCASLIAECSVPRVADPESVWRIKGSNKLHPAGLAILRELWHWREKRAIAANRPPYFILSHETLVTLAGAAAEWDSLPQILPRRMSPRLRRGIAEAIQAGMAVAAHDQPKRERVPWHRPTPAERTRFNDLQKRRDARAAELGLDPTLIASRATMVLLAADRDKHRDELMRWQQQLLLE